MQIDDRMMRELSDVRAAVKPTDTLLVVDAMTGQEAAGLVKAFNDAAELTGALASKAGQNGVCKVAKVRDLQLAADAMTGVGGRWPGRPAVIAAELTARWQEPTLDCKHFIHI